MLTRRKGLLLLIMIGMLFSFGFIPWNSGTSSDINPQLVAAAPQGVVEQAADPVPHGPIFIDNDGDFEALELPGDGSFERPYRIENYVFTGSSELIHIRGTTKWFVITDCQLDGVDGAYNGITLYNVMNGIVADNTIENCFTAVWLDGCTGVSMEGNDISGNWIGIYLIYSYGNDVVGNTCNYNHYTGIRTLYAHDNEIRGNTCYGNGEDGIYLESSGQGNVVIDNTCDWNSWFGILFYDSYDNEVTGNTCNENGINGIDFAYSDDNKVSGNTCGENGEYGIKLFSPDHTGVVGNTCNGNFYTGIRLEFSDNNEVNGNACDGNGEHGILLFTSNGNEVLDNTCNLNGDDGFASYSLDAGIYLEHVTNSELVNNTCNDNSNGILLYDSTCITVANNTCTRNFQGITLMSSNSNTVTNNTCNRNGREEEPEKMGEGISLYEGSDSNIVTDNTCNSNDQGIVLNIADFNILANNTCNYNEVTGIELEYEANHNTLADNTCNSNNFGIWLEESNANTITHNTCNRNLAGIYLYSSNENDVTMNVCNSNVYDGMYIYLSSDNTIDGNTCNGNERRGITLSASDWNSVRDNTLRKNVAVGIYVSSSDSNTFSGNTLSLNDYGFYLAGSSSNQIYRNAIIDNGIQAYERGSIEMNFWYHRTLLIGNIWSDYIGVDFDLDGIGDTDVPWPEEGFDPYPLVTGDFDNDGLSYYAELIIGTDPENSDSDFDGFSDADEWRLYFTDPLVPDSPQEVTAVIESSLQELVDEGMLDAKDASPLVRKLNAAIDLMDRGKLFQAAQKLGDFIDQVNALIRSGRLSAEDGKRLITLAQGIIDALDAM